MPWRAWAWQTVRKASVGAVHEVGAGAAVDVQIDEAGREIAALQVDDFGIGGAGGVA